MTVYGRGHRTWHSLAMGAVVTNVKMQKRTPLPLDGTLKILFAE